MLFLVFSCAAIAGESASDFMIPVFQGDFSETVLFAQRWDFVGDAQKNIVVKDGAVHFTGNPPDGIAWKEITTDGHFAEAEIVKDKSTESSMVQFTPDKNGRIVIGGFDYPCEVRHVTIYAKYKPGSNLIANSGFEYDNDGVPPGFCNRSSFAADKCTPADYTDKYLKCFMVDENEKHSGKQSLKITVGPFVRSFDFFPWNTPTEKGRSGVLSVWAKASETGVKFKLKLGNDSRTVDLMTEWARYEVTTTNLPAPGIFSPVWFEVPELAKRKTEAAIWLDDLQMEIVDTPGGGFDPHKAYASEYRPKTDEAGHFKSSVKPAARNTGQAELRRREGEIESTASAHIAPLSPSETALNGYPLSSDGLILGHYNFYMNEKTAEFRMWNGKGGFAETSMDISNMPCGTNTVIVKALDKEWQTTITKLPYRKGATQINQWSRSIVHDGEPVIMCAPCLIGSDVMLRPDGGSTQIDILAEAGFKYLHLENHANVPNIEKNAKLMDYAAKKGMKFIIWPLEGDLSEVGYIKDGDNKPSDWSRRKMYELLDNDNVIVQMVMDEPEYRKPDDVQAFMKREMARFPYKPVMMNNTWLGISNRFAGLPTDILMLVYQLTCEDTTVETVVSRVDDLRVIAPGKPCWYFLCSENSLHSHIPSYKEQFAQCWGSVAAGASGLCWFVNMPTSLCNFNAMKDINRELLEQKDFLCSDELCGGAVTSESKENLRCLTRKCGGEWRIYTVNVISYPNPNVIITLPQDLPQNAKIDVLYENRVLQADNGTFTDSYGGFSRHIYRIK